MSISGFKQGVADIATGSFKLGVGVVLKVTGAFSYASPRASEISSMGSQYIKESWQLIQNAHLSIEQKNHLYRTCPNPDCLLNTNEMERLFWTPNNPPALCRNKHISGKVPKISREEFIQERFDIIYQSPGVSLKDINTFILAEAHTDPQHQADIAEFIEEYGERGATLLLELFKSLEPVNRNESIQAILPDTFSIRTLGWDSVSLTDLLKMVNPPLSEEEIEGFLKSNNAFIQALRSATFKVLDLTRNIEKFTEEEAKELLKKIENEEGERYTEHVLRFQTDPVCAKILMSLSQILKDTLEMRAKAEVATFEHLDEEGCPQKIAVTGLLHALRSKETETLYDYADKNKVVMMRSKTAFSPEVNALIASVENSPQSVL